jgi:hypothetical protein
MTFEQFFVLSMLAISFFCFWPDRHAMRSWQRSSIISMFFIAAVAVIFGGAV